jgi:hypothetical protein
LKARTRLCRRRMNRCKKGLDSIVDIASEEEEEDEERGN